MSKKFGKLIVSKSNVLVYVSFTVKAMSKTTENRIPKCSYCRNHRGDDAPQIKGHKCPIKHDNDHIQNCVDGCKEVKERQTSVAQEKRNRYQKRKAGGNIECESKSRPCCKCGNHGIRSYLKNKHFKVCKFSKCQCEACKLTDTRRLASTANTKLYRNQKNKKNKAKSFYASNSPDSGYEHGSDGDSNVASPDSSMAFSPEAPPYSPVTPAGEEEIDNFEEMEVEVLNCTADEVKKVYSEAVEVINLNIDESDADEIMEQLPEIVSEEILQNLEKEIKVNSKFQSIFNVLTFYVVSQDSQVDVVHMIVYDAAVLPETMEHEAGGVQFFYIKN